MPLASASLAINDIDVTDGGGAGHVGVPLVLVWPSKACASPPPAFVLIYLADNDYNAGIHDAAVTKAERGCDVVCASRFMPGGGMVSCPWPERRVLVRLASFT